MPLIWVELSYHARGPWGTQLEDASRQLATQLASSDGLVWQSWLENSESQRAALVSLFTSREAAENFVQQHRGRLEELGVIEMETRLFALNVPLSALGGCPPAMLAQG